MTVTLEHLLSPFDLNGKRLRNRVALPALSVRLADKGLPGPRLFAWYEARARSAGLIITETVVVYPQTAQGASTGLTIWHQDAPERYHELVGRLHALGTLLVAQIGHAGSQIDAEVLGRPAYAPSPIPWAPGGDIPRELPLLEIERWVGHFATAAARAKECGFDGVEIHGAHGYLIHQFLTPNLNLRRDDYGGSVAKRGRFAVEIARAVRHATGNDFLVGMRVSGDEYAPGGVNLPDQLEVVKMLNASSAIDYIGVSAGSNRTMERIVPPMYLPWSVHEDLAAAVREAVAPTAVMASGRIVDPGDAERLLSEGACDLVAMGRALIADPDLIARSIDPSSGPARLCIGLNDCWRRGLVKALPISCSVNPETGQELSIQTQAPPKVSRRVVVVGAGPAGLEAAYRLARRGHPVTILEKDNQVGGTVRIAGKAAGRESLLELCAYYERALATAGVVIELGTVADPETILARGPDVVILATGGRPLRVTGVESDSAHDLRSALIRPELIGERVVVYTVDRMLAGLSVADSLAQMGRNVTVVTPHPHAGPGLEPGLWRVISKRLFDAGVTVQCSQEFVAWSRPEVRCRSAWAMDGAADIVLAADTFVYDFGEEAGDTGLGAQISAAARTQAPTLVRIGDCVSPRSIQAAVADGYREALRV